MIKMTPGAQLPMTQQSEQFCYNPPQFSCYNNSASFRSNASTCHSQSLRGVPTLPTTRCSCVLISSNSSTKRTGTARPRKMRKSILQFAKRLWSSEEPVSTRRALCTNCKTDPVTQSTLCKKCCRRSTVCAACYSRILSLHHTRLDRFGSLGERPAKCSECDLLEDRSTRVEDNSVAYITPQTVAQKARGYNLKSRSLEGPQPVENRTLDSLSAVQVTDTVTGVNNAVTGVNNALNKVTKQKSYSSSDSDYQSCSENIDPVSQWKQDPPGSQAVKADQTLHKSTALPPKSALKQTVAPRISEISNISRRSRSVEETSSNLAARSTVARSRLSNPNRPAMVRSRAIDECDELSNVMVKRSSMSENVVLKPDVILPGRLFDKLTDKENLKTPDTRRISADNVRCHDNGHHAPVEFTRSFSESSKDRMHNKKDKINRPRHASISADSRQPRNHDNPARNLDNEVRCVKRTVRIAEEENLEYSRPCSLEVEHVTVGEVTPTVYVKDTQNIIDESIQKSESVLKRSLSVSSSRLQRKLSKKLAQKERTTSQSEDVPFLRRNRSSSSVDKSSPPPDIDMLTSAGMKIEDIHAFGSLYVHKLENQMRNIESLKEVEKQHNISCRERLKQALDTHEQLAADLEDVKKQLKECMEKYRFISETFV